LENFPKKSSHFEKESYKMAKIFGGFQWIPLLVSIFKDPQIHVLKNARLHFYMKYHTLAQVLKNKIILELIIVSVILKIHY
jgi:hypothetical protein